MIVRMKQKRCVWRNSRDCDVCKATKDVEPQLLKVSASCQGWVLKLLGGERGDRCRFMERKTLRSSHETRNQPRGDRLVVQATRQGLVVN